MSMSSYQTRGSCLSVPNRPEESYPIWLIISTFKPMNSMRMWTGSIAIGTCLPIRWLLKVNHCWAIISRIMAEFHPFKVIFITITKLLSLKVKTGMDTMWNHLNQPTIGKISKVQDLLKTINFSIIQILISQQNVQIIKAKRPNTWLKLKARTFIIVSRVQPNWRQTILKSSNCQFQVSIICTINPKRQKWPTKDDKFHVFQSTKETQFTNR